MATQITNGLAVLYVADHRNFIAVDATVCRVTKTQFRVKVGDQVRGPFRLESNWAGDHENVASKSRGWSPSDYVSPVSKRENLKKAADQAVAERKAKQDAHAQKMADIAAREAAELAALQAVAGTSLTALTRYTTTFDNGHLMMVLEIPVRADQVERKGSREVVMVKVNPAPETIWGDNKGVEVHYTANSANNGNFASCSGIRKPTIEEGVWDALRMAYAR